MSTLKKLIKTQYARLMADAIVLSIGKSGRTWLRYQIANYYSEAYNIPFSLDGYKHKKYGAPLIIFDHERWSGLSLKVNNLSMSLYKIPNFILKNKPLIVLARNPKDVVVSLYHQAKYRTKQEWILNKYQNIQIDDFVYDQRFGISSIVSIMNQWANRIRKLQTKEKSNYLLISYEEMLYYPEKVLSKVILIVTGELNNSAINQAIEKSSFNNMKKAEEEGRYQTGILKPGNNNNTNSYKVREGGAGKYRKYLSEDTIGYADGEIMKLDSFYSNVVKFWN